MPADIKNPILSYPTFNGHRLSRTSCVLRIAPLVGVPLVVGGWKSINTSEELTPGEMYGNRAKLQGRTRGKHKATCDLEIFAEDAEKVRIALNETPGMGYGEANFNLMLTASERWLNGSFVWQALACRVMKDELSVGDNDDPLSRKFTLHVGDMLTNGISMVLENTPFGLPNI